MRVLQVTECFDAGVGYAIIGYARATASTGVVSDLLADNRQRGPVPGTYEDAFDGVEVVTGGKLALVRRLAAAARSGQYDVVHLHSSWAGLIGRLPGVIPRRVGLVYSPHCFAFARTDLSPVVRTLIRGAERLLARRRVVLAAVGFHEESLAKAIGLQRTKVVFLTLPDESPAPTTNATQGPLRVVTVGRVCAQKGADLAAIMARDPRLRGAVRWQWLGGGDDALARSLTDAGIEVSGWLPHEELVAALRDADIMLHTGAWEGTVNVSMLEAIAMGKPVVARQLPAYDDLLAPANQFRDPDSGVDLVLSVRNAAARDRLIAGADQARTLAQPEVVADHLRACYASASTRKAMA